MRRQLHTGQRRPGEALTQGNSHLGPSIYTFSIPALSTCPGATLACVEVCYALKFLFEVHTTLALHRANWERALAVDTFVRDMVAELRYRMVKVCRIHVAGDFFSAEYIRAWAAIARRCKDVTFLFYTRSWRVVDLAAPLVELAGLPNVFAWWSEDRDSGPCPLPFGRRAFLCTTAADEALVPRGVHLVFREDTRVPRKWVGPVWVCPKEQGTLSQLTCSACRRCFLGTRLPRRRRARG